MLSSYDCRKRLTRYRYWPVPFDRTAVVQVPYPERLFQRKTSRQCGKEPSRTTSVRKQAPVTECAPKNKNVAIHTTREKRLSYRQAIVIIPVVHKLCICRCQLLSLCSEMSCRIGVCQEMQAKYLRCHCAVRYVI